MEWGRSAMEGGGPTSPQQEASVGEDGRTGLIQRERVKVGKKPKLAMTANIKVGGTVQKRWILNAIRLILYNDLKKMVELDFNAGPGQFPAVLCFLPMDWLLEKVNNPIVFEAIDPFFVPSDVLNVFEILAKRQENAREGERAKDEEEIDSAEEN
ncbi:hypothetical protein RHSIM_Rhsim11G0114300 [Rhododendron simsii]|uniref:Uncharacterized protein n=1 Tax=Rhododendron simsii TaxID=118357 RepID=A0A834GBF5_RHOSS|nr:hypothetical protein RHSIM_Rhsim11G0114300 [Rhododendron simsii]